MITKVLEIRDSATFIPVIATQIQSANYVESYYIRRCGYGYDTDMVILSRLETGESTNDPNKWITVARTMQVAHTYIQDHFNELNSGDVVDVEYILGETVIVKTSERL